MGLQKGYIKLIIEVLGDAVARGRALTFGVQAIEGNYDQLKECFTEVSSSPRVLTGEEIVYEDMTQYGRTVHQTVFFKMLGFEDADSIDVYPDEKPTHILDLNKPLPEELTGKYDLVLDSGTLEHCFNTPQVLENAVSLIKTGGRIIHISPLSGWVGHGFYSFSPTLFRDFYEANGFKEMECRIITIHNYRGSHNKARMYAFDYHFDQTLRFSDFHCRALVFFTALKGRPIEKISRPIQRKYRKKFGKEKNGPKEQEIKPWNRLLSIFLPSSAMSRIYDYISLLKYYMNRRPL